MSEEIKVIRVWPEAHGALDQLCVLLAKEKGLRDVNYTDAASIAILEAVERRKELIPARKPAKVG